MTTTVMPFHPIIIPQRKIDEAEAKRQQYEQQRDAVKAKIHGLNSVDVKVGAFTSNQAHENNNSIGYQQIQALHSLC